MPPALASTRRKVTTMEPKKRVREFRLLWDAHGWLGPRRPADITGYDYWAIGTGQTEAEALRNVIRKLTLWHGIDADDLRTRIRVCYGDAQEERHEECGAPWFVTIAYSLT